MAKIKVKNLPKKKQLRREDKSELEKVRGGALRVPPRTAKSTGEVVVTFGTPTIES